MAPMEARADIPDPTAWAGWAAQQGVPDPWLARPARPARMPTEAREARAELAAIKDPATALPVPVALAA
jgi:hypothetical protein